MRASDGLGRPGNLQDVGFRNRIADFLQFLHHQGETGPARFREFRDFIGQILIVDVEIVAQNMDVVVVHLAAEFNPRNDVDRFRRVKSLLVQMTNPVYRVMIGNRDIGKSRLFRRSQEFFRRKLPIRKTRMGM